MDQNSFYPIWKFFDVIGVDRTLTYLNDRLERNPKDAEAWMLRGNFHDESTEDTGKALRDYSIAIALDPTYADAYVKRSSTHDERGEHQQALEDADEAIRLNPNIALAYVNRAAALAALGRHTEADSDVAHASKLGFDTSTVEEWGDELRWRHENKLENS